MMKPTNGQNGKNTFRESRLRFEFPPKWKVIKLDESKLHRQKMCNFAGGTKAVDFVALPDTDEPLWLIEVKDYRKAEDIKDILKIEEQKEREERLNGFFRREVLKITKKMRDSLATLVIMRTREDLCSSDSAKADYALSIKRRIQFAFHIELPPAKEKIFGSESELGASGILITTLAQIILQEMKRITSNPWVGDTYITKWQHNKCGWTVTDLQ